MRGIILDLLGVGGIGLQSLGIYLLFGFPWAAAIVGTELLAIGIAGALISATG